MDSYSLDEAAHLLKPTPDYFSKTLEQLRNMILFAGKTHPILKPCVFFPEPVSMRLAHRNANIYVQESGIEHTMKSVNALPDDPAEAARQKRVNRHWPEDALTPFKYPQVMCQGLFELTFYPEHMDMAEVKESGRIQLYRGKAVRAPLANAAVDRIMNGWYAMSREEVSRAKARTRQEIGDIVILTQGDLHYLVDAPVSIPLSDIRITDKMLTEYAAREGIILPKPHPALPPLTILQPIPNVKTFTQEEVAVILKTDADSVFNRMMGRLGVLLQPSIIIKKPVQMQRTEFVGGNPDDYGRGAEQITVKEGLTGVFGVGGIRPLQWDELGLAQITFGDSSGVLLSQGERSYMVKDPLKIRREDLVVTDVDLLQYGKETIGVTFELLQTENEQVYSLQAFTIKLPVIGGEEVIPIRLLLLITEPKISPSFLVEALWNPRGDYLSCLRHEPFYKDWTLLDKELKKIEATDDLEKQLKLLPSGVFVTRNDFEAFEFYQQAFQIKQDRAVPDDLLILAYEGFDVFSITPHRLPEQKPIVVAGQKESSREQAVNATKKQKRDNLKAPDTTNRRSARSTFMDDALHEYWTKHKKKPNTIDNLMESVKPGTANRKGDEKYEVVDVMTSPDIYLTLRTKKGAEPLSYKQVKKSFEYRLGAKVYRDMTLRAKPTT